MKAVHSEPAENEISERDRIALMSAIRSSGVFITSGLEKPNVMSTHWGTLGTFWSKEVFVLPVKKSKFSHKLISEKHCFAISVPIKDMRSVIMECDHLSGYSHDKFDKLHLHVARANKISAYTIAECGLFFECKVLCSFDADSSNMEYSFLKEMYENGDYHTMFFAEVVDCYRK